MIIGITSDHRGFEIKKEIIEYLKKNNIEVKDNGCFTLGACDYSLYGISLAEAVANKDVTYGIAICGTGIGMSIACNKVKGIRCARVVNKEEARLAKKHNNANMLALSAEYDLNTFLDIINNFINTEFSNEERHIRRIEKITNYENQMN